MAYEHAFVAGLYQEGRPTTNICSVRLDGEQAFVVYWPSPNVRSSGEGQVHGCGPAPVPFGRPGRCRPSRSCRSPFAAPPRAGPSPGVPAGPPSARRRRRRRPARFSQHLSPAASPGCRRDRRSLGGGFRRAGCARGRFPHRPRAPAPRRRRPGLRGPAGRHLLGPRPQHRPRRRPPAPRRPHGGRARRPGRWSSASRSNSPSSTDVRTRAAAVTARLWRVWIAWRPVRAANQSSPRRIRRQCSVAGSTSRVSLMGTPGAG